MWRYVLKRLLTTFLLLFGITFIVYAILELTPGDPVMIKLGTDYTPAQYEEAKILMGLDKPFLVRYFKYIYDVFLHFDFGTSYLGRSVVVEIVNRAPKTFLISISSILVATLIGIPIGIYSALNQSTWKDNTAMVVALLGVSMPDFWVGLLLTLLFALRLGWLPATGLDGPKYLILPVITCSFGTLANIARMTRSSMLEVIRQDYITTAKAKGQTRSKIIFKHALKNALIPIITVVGTQASYMMGGVMVVETVFAIGGMGTLMMSSITSLDYPMVLSCVLFISMFSCLIVLLTDIAYAFVDPRIRSEYTSGNGRKKKVKAA